MFEIAALFTDPEMARERERLARHWKTVGAHDDRTLPDAIAEAAERAEAALDAVHGVRAAHEAAELQAHVRALADRAVALRRECTAERADLSRSLDRVEQRLGHMVECLARGDLDDARTAFEEVGGEAHLARAFVREMIL